MSEKYLVEVNYSKGTEELKKEGKYTWVNNLWLTWLKEKSLERGRYGKETVEIELIDLGEDSQGALRKMMKLGYRPIVLHELLELGRQFPNIQTQFRVVALGSVYFKKDPCPNPSWCPEVYPRQKGEPRVAYLDYSSKKGRFLEVNCVFVMGSKRTRYAAIKIQG